MTPVVHQTPSIQDEKLTINKRKWILLPTIAYKILVPIEKEQRLNFFQQTILRLCLSGYKTAGYISDKLLLKEELVQYIIGELMDQELLEKNGIVSKKGQEALDELNKPYELKIGYIFFDLLTRTYWDQFILTDDLHYASAEFGDYTRKIEMGRIDAPKKRQALVLPPLNEQFNRPTALDALTVINRYGNRLKGLQQGIMYSKEENIPFLPRNIEKVEFLEEAIPIYLTTFIYMAADVLNKSNWEVCHPFGGGPSAKLQDYLNNLRNTNENLRDHIKDLVEETLRTSNIERQENMSKEELGTRQYLKEVLGHEILMYPSVVSQAQRLCQKFNDLQKLMKQTNRGSNFDDIQTQLSTFLIQSAEIIEETLFVMRHLHKVRDQKRVLSYNTILSKHRFKNADLLADVAKLIGFIDYPTKEEQVFHRFLAVAMGDVKYVDQSKKLQALVAYHLLAARDQLDHPFHQLAKTFPICIQYFERLMNKRNEFAHTTDTTYYIKTTDKVFLYTLKIISVLLELPFNEAVVAQQVKYEQDELLIDKKERLLCEKTVDLKTSSTIRTQQKLFKALVDVHYYRKTRNHHFVLKATAVLEELFNLWLNQISLQDAGRFIKRDGRQTLYVMERMLNEYGFVVNIERLPQSFTHTNTQKLKLEVQKLKDSVLSRKVYAFLASICAHKNIRWAELAKAYPNLILLTAEISDKRKHGHVVLEDEEMLEIEEKLFDFIKKIEPFIVLQKASVNGGKS